MSSSGCLHREPSAAVVQLDAEPCKVYLDVVRCRRGSSPCATATWMPKGRNKDGEKALGILI